MTKEEAIKHLKMYVDNDCYTTQHQDACRMAIAALRDKKNTAMLNRSRRDWCKYCNNPQPYCDCVLPDGTERILCSRGESFTDGFYVNERRIKFCPNCGRPLTEEAWEQLERRIEGNDGKTD